MFKYDRTKAKQLSEEKQRAVVKLEANKELKQYKNTLDATLESVTKAAEVQQQILENTVEVNARMADLLINSISENKQNRLQRSKTKEKLEKFREDIGVKK